MSVFHIIEQANTNGQSTVEVFQPTKDKALEVYFQFSVSTPLVSVIETPNTTTYEFEDCTCTIVHVDGFRMFAEWGRKTRRH